MVKLDTLLFNCEIADIFLLRLFRGWIGIREGRFLYVEAGDPPPALVAVERRDLRGGVVAPGLIDAHMHIESSLLTPRRFAEAALPHGTTAVLADPHEVANVAGAEGVRWMVDGSRDLPLYVRYALPSCVPATSPDLEWTRAVFGPEIVEEFAGEPLVAALGEVMDYRRVLEEMSTFDAPKESSAAPKEGGGSTPSAHATGSNLSRMMENARARSLLVEGHIPTLRGTELSEYLFHGVGSDHTLTNPAKLREQLSKGLCVMLQAKSLTDDIGRTVMGLEDRSRILLVTDDVEASLLKAGHLSLILSRAISCGIPPLEALASATIRPARYLGFDRGIEKRGAIAPGWTADFLVLDAISAFPPRQVFARGRVAAEGGRMAGEIAPLPRSTELKIHLPPLVREEDIRVAGRSVRSGEANAVVIQSERTSQTGLERVRLELEEGFPHWPANEDLACVAIIARDGSRMSGGVVKKLGLRRGAFAASFAHDSHNLLVVGRDRAEMARAANEVIRRRGSLVVLEGERVAAALDLPFYGLLSDEHVDVVAEALDRVEQELARLGMTRERPFLMLSLLSLSVSPLYKFSDLGIIDTESRRLLAPFVPDEAT